jgi:hypothetical protein
MPVLLFLCRLCSDEVDERDDDDEVDEERLLPRRFLDDRRSRFRFGRLCRLLRRRPRRRLLLLRDERELLRLRERGDGVRRGGRPRFDDRCGSTGDGRSRLRKER